MLLTRSLPELRHMLSWILLIIGGLFEVGFAYCLGRMKTAEGNMYLFWGAGFFCSLTLSMLLLYKGTQTIPIGTGYAVWTGIGAAGTVLIGILVFKEPATAWRLFFIATLILSIAGLRAVSPH